MRKVEAQINLPFEKVNGFEKKSGDLKLDSILENKIKLNKESLKVNMNFIQEVFGEYFGESKAKINQNAFEEFVKKVAIAMSENGFELIGAVNEFKQVKKDWDDEEIKRQKRLKQYDEEDAIKPEAWGAGASLPKRDR